MIESLLKESDKYLVEAAYALRDYKEIDEYTSIFEAEDPEVEKTEKKNQEAANKSQGFLKKAFASIKKAIITLMKNIGDFIDRLSLSKDERMSLERMEEMMRQNPELKNKKITVKDYRKIISQIDEYTDAVEKQIRSDKANQDSEVEKLLGNIGDFLKGNLEGTSVILSADVARNKAISDIKSAKEIKLLLNSDIGLMEKLEKELGKKEAKKFKRDISKYASTNKLYSMLVRLRKKKYDTLSECIKGSMVNLGKAIITGRGSMANSLKNNENTSTAFNAARKGVFKGAKLGAKLGWSKTKKDIDDDAKHQAVQDFISK